MIQHYIATFFLYGGILLSIIGWLSSFPLILLGYTMIIIFPFFLNEEYELKEWSKKYLSN